MDAFPLENIFDAAGALVAGGFIAAIVALLQQLTPLPAGGRPAMWAAAGLAAGLIVLALMDRNTAAEVAEPIGAGSAILGYVLAWLNITVSAIGARTATIVTSNAVSSTSG
jgi:hypothetical protein